MPTWCRVVVLAGLMAAGCAGERFQGLYEPKAFMPWKIADDQRIDGSALVVTSADDDAYVFSGPPSGTIGYPTNLTVPLGVITREAAMRVFGGLFRGGAEHHLGATDAAPGRVVLLPNLTKFTYRYGWYKAYLQLELHVTCRGLDGRTVYDKTLDSGEVMVLTGRDKVPPQKTVVDAAHASIQALMLDAAGEFRDALVEGSTRPSASQ